MVEFFKCRVFEKGDEMQTGERISDRGQFVVLFLSSLLAAAATGCADHFSAQVNFPVADEKVIYRAVEIFPLVKQHVHGSTIVELPNGDLLAAWFQGSGERQADDVAIMGARLRAGERKWSKPFVMADVPGFPDVNPILFIDSEDWLWLMWYTVIANQWETSLPKYRISKDYMMANGPPKWSWQDVIYVKPGDPAERGIQPTDRFVKSVERQVEEYAKYLSDSANVNVSEDATRNLLDRWRADLLAKARGENMMRRGRLLDDMGGSTEQQNQADHLRRYRQEQGCHRGWTTNYHSPLFRWVQLLIDGHHGRRGQDMAVQRAARRTGKYTAQHCQESRWDTGCLHAR